MDFVTFLRVLLRRWDVVLPGVVLTLLTVVAAGGSVAPEYEAEGSVLLLGPSTATSSQGGAVAVNPYLNIPSSLDSTAVILAETLRSEQVMRELADLGANADYEIEPTEKTPILTVTAKGSSMEQVLHTSQLVMQRAQDDLAARQQAAGAPQETFIRSQVLRPPRGTVHSGSKPRVMAAVGAVGIGLTIMLAFAVETLAGWRRQRRQYEAPAVPLAPPAGPASEVAFVFPKPEPQAGPETAHSNGWHPHPAPGPMVDVFVDHAEPESIEDPPVAADGENVLANSEVPHEVPADEASGESGNFEQPDGLVDAWWSAWERRQAGRRDAQESGDAPGEHGDGKPEEASGGDAARGSFPEVSVEDDDEAIHTLDDEDRGVDQMESRGDGDQEEKNLAAWGGSIEVLGASANDGPFRRSAIPPARGGNWSR
ncbi:MAG: hypothetical protein ABR592_11040 [Nitriliruptorales bacterium]